MPMVAAAGAAIGTAVSAGAAAVGAAVGGLSAAGLASGLMIAGTGLQLVGKVTGSKTLSNIGFGFSMAGGVTGLATSMTGKMAEKATISGTNAKPTKPLSVDNIDDALSSTTKGAKNIGDLRKFEPAGAMTQSADKTMKAIDSIGETPSMNLGQAAVVAGEMDNAGFFQRAGTTLRKYDTMANVAMGMGNAYMQNTGIEAQKDMFDKRLEFDREQVARTERNYGAPSTPYNLPLLQRVPGTFQPNGFVRN